MTTHYYDPITGERLAERRAERETAWLIERPHRHTPERAALWWSADACYGPWSTPALAVRFARKEDAEAMIVHLGIKDAIATEHEWAALPALPLHELLMPPFGSIQDDSHDTDAPGGAI